MEVLEASEAVLCNHEVLSFLKEQKESKNRKSGGSIATLRLEAITHLDSTPCAQQSDEKVKNFLEALDNLKVELTSSEKLMLVNLAPKSAVELHLVVEHSEDRLDDQQVEKIVGLVRSVLLEEPEEEEEEEQGEEGEEEEQDGDEEGSQSE